MNLLVKHIIYKSFTVVTKYGLVSVPKPFTCAITFNETAKNNTNKKTPFFIINFNILTVYLILYQFDNTSLSFILLLSKDIHFLSSKQYFIFFSI